MSGRYYKGERRSNGQVYVEQRGESSRSAHPESRSRRAVYSESSVSGHGKHYTPDPHTRELYRSSDKDKAMEYVQDKDPKNVYTTRPGDFHTPHQKAAYFTPNLRYAQDRAHRDQVVIAQKVPVEYLNSAYQFEAEQYPRELQGDWYDFVQANRRSQRAEGHLRAVQHEKVIIGPESTAANAVFRGSAPVERHRFKPMIHEGAYTQQVVIKDEVMADIAQRHQPRILPRGYGR